MSTLSTCSGFAISALLLACLAPGASAMDGSNGNTSVTDLPPADDVGGSRIVADQDLDFIDYAASVGKYEIESSQYVVASGLTGDARTFAEAMAADHFVITNRLKTLLGKKGLAIPERMTFDDRVAISRLKDTREDQLGKAYVGAQVKAQTAEIKLYTDEAAKGVDAELRAFAQSNLPLLQKQLEKAQLIAGGGQIQ